MSTLPTSWVCALLVVTASFAAESTPLAPQKNYAVGRITMPEGKPITADVDEYDIRIYGVSDAGEKVYYSPVVKNGAYRQKLVPGQFAFSPSRIKVRFKETVFAFPLVPVGKNWKKNQDAEDGIVQDFVWKTTGVAETYGEKPNPNNATHWHGLCVGMRWQTYRSDLKRTPTPLPEGTKLAFTFTPTSKAIDGSELQPITLERQWRPKDLTPNDDLNDLPPANYELTGTAQLPDGTTKPILFQGRGHYPNFVTKAPVPLEPDSSTSGIWKQLMGWTVN